MSDKRKKLTAEQVEQIRASKERPFRLAKRFGVSYTRIWAIRKGLSWKRA